jgi:hypothetical protein
MTFSFIDYGAKDFVRGHDGESLKLKFNSWGAADSFVEDGGLEEYGWTNEGTKKICWEDEE